MTTKDETTPTCRCVPCPECRGGRVVWFALGGREYLGTRRCDDLDEMETCDECRGSGVYDVCDKCAEEMNDGH